MKTEWGKANMMATVLFIHRASKNVVPVQPDDLSTFPNKPREIM